MQNNSVKRNMGYNMLRQVCSAVFPLITFPYITRILGETNYGKVQFSYTFINYYVLIAGLGITWYSVRELARIRDNKKQVNQFASEIFSINVITTVITYGLLLCTVLLWPKVQQYALLLAIQSAAIFLHAIGTEWINIVYEDYRYLTLRYIVIQIVALICMFIFVKKQEDYIIYALILTLAATGGNLCNLFYVRRYVRVKFTLCNHWRTHLKPMFFLFQNSIASTLYENSDITMLGVLRTDAEVGLYSAAVRIYAIVKQIINAITAVTVPRISNFAKNNNLEQCQRLLNDVYQGLLLLLLPAIVGLFCLSKDIIFVVAGQSFAESAVALRILCVALGFAVLGCFYSSTVLIPFREEKKFLYTTVTAASANIIANFFVIPVWGMLGAAMTTVMAEAIVMILCGYWARKYFVPRMDLRYYGSIFIGCVGIACCCIFLQKIVANIILRTCISIVLSCLLYGAILLILKNKLALSMVKKYYVAWVSSSK